MHNSRAAKPEYGNWQGCWMWGHERHHQYDNVTSQGNLEVTVGSARNHQKLCDKATVFPVIPRVTCYHFLVFLATLQVL